MCRFQDTDGEKFRLCASELCARLARWPVAMENRRQLCDYVPCTVVDSECGRRPPAMETSAGRIVVGIGADGCAPSESK